MNEMNRYGAPMRGVSPEVRAKMGTARESPRARAEREAREAQEAQDPWEARRQELAERGDIFDVKGNITRNGEAILRASGWNAEQIRLMEEMQKNNEGEATEIPEEPRAFQQVSSIERARVKQRAEQNAANELARRQKEENEIARLRDQARRTAEGKRAMAGVRAFANTLKRTGSTQMAKQEEVLAGQDVDNRDGNGQAA